MADETMLPGDRLLRSWRGVVACLVVAGALNLSFLHNRLEYASDARAYLTLARSLVAGEGYMLDGEPLTIWPPVYPLVIAPLQAAAPDAIWLVKLLHVLWATAALACFAAAFRRLPGAREPLLVVVVAGCSLPWMKYTHGVGAEPLFFLGCGLLVWLLVRAHERPRQAVTWGEAAVIALLPVVRLAGVAAIVAGLWRWWGEGGHALRALRQRHWPALAKTGAWTLLALLPLGLWFLRNHLVSGQVSGYADAFEGAEFTSNAGQVGITGTGVLSRMLVTTLGYGYVWVVPDMSHIERIRHLPWFVHVGCWLIALTMLVGWARSLLRPAWRTVGVFYAAYGGILLVTCWYDLRYLAPVLPLYLLYLAEGSHDLLAGLVAAARRLGGAWSCRCLQPAWVLRLGLLVAVVGMIGVSLASPPARRLRSPTYSGNALTVQQACHYLRGRPETGAVLTITRGFIDWWSGRPVYSITRLAEHDGHGAAWPEHVPDEVRFFFWERDHPVNQEISDYREALLAAQPGQWTLAASFNDGQILVYERHPPHESASP